MGWIHAAATGHRADPLVYMVQSGTHQEPVSSIEPITIVGSQRQAGWWQPPRVPQRASHGECHLKWALDGQAVPAGMGPGCGRSNQHMMVSHVQGKLVGETTTNFKGTQQVQQGPPWTGTQVLWAWQHEVVTIRHSVHTARHVYKLSRQSVCTPANSVAQTATAAKTCMVVRSHETAKTVPWSAGLLPPNLKDPASGPGLGVPSPIGHHQGPVIQQQSLSKWQRRIPHVRQAV